MSYLTCYSAQCGFVYSLLKAAAMHVTAEQIPVVRCHRPFNIKSLSNLRCACRCAASRPAHITFNHATVYNCYIMFNVKLQMVSFLNRPILKTDAVYL